MAKSLASIKSQIEKLQKQADSIQSTVISRIKREISQHGLTVDDLFGTDIRSVGNGLPAQSKKAAKSGSAKVAKFADGQGNTWGGMGKRPQWIHAALEAGRALEEFLVGNTAKPAEGPKVSAKRAKKAVPAKKAALAKKVATKKAAATKAMPAAKAPAKKGPKAAVAAKPSRKVAAKKVPAKKAAATKTTKAAVPAAAQAPAAQA